MTELDWAAGLFEGEGCITLTSDKRVKHVVPRKRLSLSLTMKDEDVVRRFCDAVGFGSVSGPHKNGCFRWQVTGYSAIKMLQTRTAFVSQLCSRRTIRLRECMREIHSQPAPLTNRESGLFGGRPRRTM